MRKPSLEGTAFESGSLEKGWNQARLPETLEKVPDILVPSDFTPAMIATPIKEAISPYSMAVAPESFAIKTLILFSIANSIPGGAPLRQEPLAYDVTIMTAKF
jgi:hypothetical protein